MASGTACAKIQKILNCFQIKTVQDLVSPSLGPAFCDVGFIFSLYLMDPSNSRLISFWLLIQLKRKRALSPVPEKVFYCISLALTESHIWFQKQSQWSVPLILVMLHHKLIPGVRDGLNSIQSICTESGNGIGSPKENKGNLTTGWAHGFWKHKH